MGVGFKVGGSAVFKSFVTIQANPNVDVSLISDAITYSARADSNGIANFIVKKKGTYTVWSGSGANSEAEGNTPTIDVLKPNRTYTGQRVKLNAPSYLRSGVYSSNVLALYWDKPNGNWTGCELRWGKTTYPANRSEGSSISIGAGGDIDLTSTSTVNGFKHTGLTAETTYYYTLFPYITINNVKYWSTVYRSANGTAKYYIGTVLTITDTNKNWAVPTGWRTMKVFVVGGGGGGSSGGGGGAGGITATSADFDVVPGSTYVATVGAGGTGGGATGGNGGETSFGSKVSAAGGGGGSGQNGGSGGSGGGAAGIYRSDQYDCSGTAGASDGGKAYDNVYYTGAAHKHTYSGGYGQGGTTRAWGLSNGTLYAGGGGGGTRSKHYTGGSGGAGGGGAGSSDYTVAGGNGGTNTGGGGGGGAYSSSSESSSNGGNGGKGVILVKCIA